MAFEPLFPYLLFALVLAAVAAAVTWAMARSALLVDVPNARSSHIQPTPRGGGIGIMVAFGVGLIVLRYGAEGAQFADPPVAGLVAGAVIMGLAGLADDIHALSFAVKLAAQVAAAIFAMSAGLVIEVLYVPGGGPWPLGLLAYPATLLWLVGLTNAYNFMDGLDGLAGGTAALAAAFLCAVAVMLGQPATAMLALALTAASIGFLAFNLPPARIFMGDVGSQFLGFTFAGLGVLLARGDTTGTLILVAPLLLFHFLFDTLFTALRRLRNGENPTAAHRTHLYQLLNRSGFGHRQVAIAHALMALLQGVGAVWLVAAEPASRWRVFLPFLAVYALYARIALQRFSRGRDAAAGS